MTNANNPEFKYQNIAPDMSNRTEKKFLNNNQIFINPEEEAKRKTHDKELIEEQKNLPKFEQPQTINKGKPMYLDVKTFILQNPNMHLYGKINNFAVCPYCRYTGNVDIEYERSAYQKKLCCYLTSVGLFLCSWIPLVNRALADQIYKCHNCKKILRKNQHGMF